MYTKPAQPTGASGGQEQPRSKSGLFVVLASALALVGTLFLYREAIQLPFLFDDMIHLRWLDWHSLPAIWTTAEGLGYYRPLTMSVWKVADLLLGYNDPALLHPFNLFLHALNAVLAGCLAWRAYRDRGRMAYALLAASIFLTFPFSYQAVPSTSSLSKPLIATLTLGSAILYWEARRRPAAWLLAPSLLLGIAAPFAYETGVMVPLAIVAVEAYAYLRGEFRRLSWFPLLYVIPIWGIALPLLLWMEPESGASVGLPALLSLWQNGVYFLEGLLFPITPLATPLERLLNIDQYLLLGILSLLGLVGLLLFYRWVRQIKLLLFALSWFLVGILPLWLMLDFAYVITSPRLLYLGAVGSALIWAGVPIFLWARLPARLWPKAMAVALILAILGFNVAYVRQKMELADAIAAPLWQAARAAADRAAEGGTASTSLLYLNVPAWVAPKQPVYRVGTEGLTFIPEYVRVQDFVYVTTGAEPEIRAFQFDPVKQDWRAYVGYAGPGLAREELSAEIRRAGAVFLTIYPGEALQFVEAGSVQPRLGPPDTSAAARFGEGLWLLDHRLEQDGPNLILHLWWYGQRPPDSDATVFVHLYDETGQLVTQADGYPMLGLFPLSQWQAGDVVHDLRYLALPTTLADRPYSIVVGWYDPATGDRLSAVDRLGQPAPDGALQVFPP